MDDPGRDRGRCRARHPRGDVPRGLAAVKPDAALMTRFRFKERLRVTDLTVDMRLSGGGTESRLRMDPIHSPVDPRR
jgi:hypothetical protein